MPQVNTPCGLSITHKITIPTSPTALEFQLGHTDYTENIEKQDVGVQVKSGRFTRSIQATTRSFDIKLYHVTADIVLQIKNFAETDLFNYISNGVGSITLDLGGQILNGCYIEDFPNFSETIFDNDTNVGVEYFAEISFKVVYPKTTWF